MMKRYHSFLFTTFICFLLPAVASVSAQPLAPINTEGQTFVEALMRRMTLHEKLGQLNLQVAGDITTGQAQDTHIGGAIARGEIGGVFNIKGGDKIRALQDIAVRQSRLGIPLLVGMDVIHGYETVFPIPLALSCSWDLDAAEEVARISAHEASADGIAWTFSPMVDVALDARWGRISEGSGEDPLLAGLFGAAMVRGYQGSDMADADRLMSCVKHFALYGAVESGRDYNTVDMSHVRMFNQYFPPYRCAIDAGAGSVMTSFNLVDGIPATANKWLVCNVLRHAWGYDGLVVTDYASISEILNHGTAESLREASMQALTATTDMDMCAQGFLHLDNETLTSDELKLVDEACRRVLEAKWRLGLFRDPYARLDEHRRERDIASSEHRDAARRIAAETFVLLKNDAVLPLKKSARIALIGPLADNRVNMDGTWAVASCPERNMTLLEAMQETVAGRGEVRYAQGCNLISDSTLQAASEFGKTIARGNEQALHDEVLAVALDADVIVCAMGECADMSGESSSRSDLLLPDAQSHLLQKLVQLGKPVVLLNFAGRPTVLTWEQEHVDAIMNVWFGGTEAAPAICDVLFGDRAPQGRLTVSMPRATGQEPLYYNHLRTGRPAGREWHKYQSNYLDTSVEPLYPFGYGLTYTTFSYSPITLSTNEISMSDSITVSVNVTNTGLREGCEVVQLYICDRVARVARPVKELKDFERISLQPGETRTVRFTLCADKFQYFDGEGNICIDPGLFDIMVGPNSRDVQTANFNLVDTNTDF